ncbi:MULTISPECIES: ABC transporter permease subunit [Brucella]|uniref:Spermidine Putrescine ABC transporter permease component potC (TC_3.A.1.11.1) n=1 Tax=Ochrobactrum soli TaxID=2448455 RepID=A0A2P9HDD0_9HYPH|nr:MULTISPECIES: ABC transporter permease subunit [Brucella]MCI0999421.1 ABC transporter permease subunit [Ochrobactrum sp. C6C9]MDX4074245.1 ABC transporter permease subunit [Brucella sp. NBRC 113783]SPL62108.1 Spermidine Putrescine ABC transporter permease component potC (TC_3.A.1.11.1) [[Ochrobactrum] soli]
MSALPTRTSKPPRPLWIKHSLMITPLIVLLLAFLVYPVGKLLSLSFIGRDGFSLAAYQQLFASSLYLNVLWITLKISLATTALSVVLGYPVAYLISTAGPKAKSWLIFLVLLSFWTSFLVRAFAWVVILGRNGAINQFLLAIGVIDRPANLIYSLGAVLVGMVHAMLPLAVMTMLSVMENIDRNLPRAASTLGARPGSAFWTVYFPLSMPGVAAAAIMVFVTSIGFFIVPALLGGRFETMITQLIIDQVQQTLNWGLAGAISVLLLVVVLAVFVIYDRIFGFESLTGETSAINVNRDTAARRAGAKFLAIIGDISDRLIALFPGSRKSSDAETSPKLLSGFVWALLIMISLPAIMMIPISFSAAGLNWPPSGFTMQWYEQMWNTPVWSQALWRSLVVALGAGILSMLIGIPAAFLLARANIRGKAAILAFVLSPIVAPRIIIAVGLFYVFAELGLVGTSLGLIIGHTVVCVPYVVMTMVAVLRNYDTRLDLAAQSLGASPMKSLAYVTFPMLAAGMFSAFLFAFATSFDELTIALFSSGGLNSTLPKQFWDEVTLQVSPVIAAVSTCLLVFISVLIFVADRLRQRSMSR